MPLRLDLALRADGTVAGWGLNDEGQSIPPVGLTNVVAISAGYWHSIALRADGTLVCWGALDYCQPAVSGSLSGVIAISSDNAHSMALADAGGDALNPCDPDSDGDGMPDGWEAEHGFDPLDDADAILDGDGDGLSNQEEFGLGSNPHAADTDGDGLTDGEELAWGSSPLSPDGDLDGLPDWVEMWCFGTDPLDHDTDGDGATDGQEALGGRDPTRPNAADEWDMVVVSTNLVSAKLYDGFSLPAGSGLVVSNQVLLSRTFEINRHGGWEQFFISSSADGASGSWLYGAVLEWSDSSGASGVADFSWQDSFRLPLSTNSPTHVTLVLRAVRDEVYSDGPLYLLKWSPLIAVSGAVCGVGDGAACFAIIRETEDSGIHLSFDFTGRPCFADLSDSEIAARLNPFPHEQNLVFTPDESGPPGGTLSAKAPGAYEMPPLLTPEPDENPPPDPMAPMEAGGGGWKPGHWILFIDPRMTYGDGHCGGCGGALLFDTGTARYSQAYAYPLDSRCLRDNWNRDETGAYSCSCTAEITYGDDSLKDWLYETIHDDVPGVHAIGRILLGNQQVWEGEATHHVADDCHERGVGLFSSDPCDGCSSGCADGNCDDLEDDGLDSLRFRIPLGMPREGQVSGFLWFLADEPLSITPAMFDLLARDDAAITDTTAGGIRTVVCSDVRGRTAVIEPIANGVRVTLRKTADNSLEHTWVITNVMGSASQIQLTKISRLNNLMRDVTYTCIGDGRWWRFDHIAQASEWVTLDDSLNSGADGVLREERIVRDAANVVLSHEIVESSRFGFGQNAVLRETCHATLGLKPDGGLGWVEDFATYWADDANLRRNGLPRLVWGESRPWSYQAWDDEGREILRLDQYDGSEVPSDMSDLSDLSDLSNYPTITAIATISDYTPLPGDSGDPADIDAVRTESRHLVRDGVSTLIGRTWWIYTHGTDGNGRATVTVQTIRACSQTAALDAPGNAVSTETRYDADADGIPLLLRGRLVTSTDEDGVTTTYDYALGVYDSSSRAFTPGGAGTALRTLVSRSTAAAPNGIPGKSTQTLTIEDAAHGTTLYTATLLQSTGTVLDWQAHVYDDKNRLRSTLYSDGSSSTNAYSCCRLLFTIDRNGYKTLRSAETGKDHLYYAMEEVSLREITANHPTGLLLARHFRVTQHFMDALGRETNTVIKTARTDGIMTNPNAWTPAYPRFANTMHYPFGISDYSVQSDQYGARTVAMRLSSGEAERSVEQTFHPTNYVMPSTVTSNIWYRNGHSISERRWDGKWTRESQFKDYADDGTKIDVIVTDASDYTAPVTNQVSITDFLGRTVFTITPMGMMSNVYDGATSRMLSTTSSTPSTSSTTTFLYDDLGEQVGTVRLGITDGSDARYENIGGEIWRVATRWRIAGGETGGVSVVRSQMTGLSNSLRSRTLSVGENGMTNIAISTFDPATKILTSTTQTASATPVVTKTKFGILLETQDRSAKIVYYRDAFLLPTQVFTHRPDGTLLTRQICMTVAVANWQPMEIETRHGYSDTSAFSYEYMEYDELGRVSTRTDDLGNTVEYAYDLQGSVAGQFGDVYPSRYEYDTMGRMKALGTTRDGSVWDWTGWHFDPATGLATNKVYADNSVIAYTYTDDGQPERTIWARSAWKENAYDSQGRLVGISHSDATPAVSLTYDAFQRLASASTAVAAYAYANSALGIATNETATVDGKVCTLTRRLDDRHRLAGLALSPLPLGEGQGEGPAPYWVAYGYDAENEVCRIAFTNSAGRGLAVNFTSQWGRALGYQVSTPSGGVFVHSLQRDARRPELVASASQRYNGVPIRSSAYSYDTLNRVFKRIDNNAGSPSAVTNTFGYNSRSEVAAATVSSTPYTYDYDEIGSQTLTTSGGVWMVHLANSLNQYTDRYCGSVSPPEPWFEFAYDDDGNLLSDGLLDYAWDAENRLVAAYSNSVCIVSNAYDHASRRVLKFTPTATYTFVYDGWNLVQEVINNQQSTITNQYVWGKDLSGTMQGAGGVGGLLAVSMGGQYYFPCHDANGNVTAYVDEQGAVVAEYAYDAFGLTISQSDTMSDAFPHRFSTKYFDAETGLYYYGYRFYNPILHRWLNRDPIEENGGVNLYAFCGNNGVNAVDLLGMAKFYVYFTGDSLTHGHNDIGKNGEGKYDGYKHMLTQELKKKFSRHHDFEFGGIGAPGRKLEQIASDMKNVKQKIPDKCNGIIILFLAGMNNMPTSGTTPDIDKNVDAAFASWKVLRDDIVSQVGSCEYQRLFLAMTLPSLSSVRDDTDPKYWRRNYSISRMNQKILGSTLSRQNLTYMTVGLGTVKPSQYPPMESKGDKVAYDLYEIGNHIEDGLHYRDKGNQIIAETLLGKISPWIMDGSKFARKGR